MKGLLKRSMEDRMKLHMIYQAADGTLSQRVIHVKAYNERHVIAYCYVRRKTRMFQFDRILSLQITKSRTSDSLSE